MNRSIRKADILLLGAFLMIGVLLGAYLLLTARHGSTVEVSVDGEVTKTFDLSKDTTYTIEGADGGTNELVISGGEAWLEDASCPDRLCVRMGRISRGGQSVICLPNKVVVRIVEEEDSEGSGTADGSTEASEGVDIIAGGRQ